MSIYKSYLIFFLSLIGVFLIDKSLKDLFINGLYFENRCITFGYTLNKGVAFSMLSFLGKYLKWILLILISITSIYIIYKKYIIKYPLILGVLFGAALGNLYDRFMYGGVIDYIYWHCGFDFAIFNFADVMIDISILSLLLLSFKKK